MEPNGTKTERSSRTCEVLPGVEGGGAGNRILVRHPIDRSPSSKRNRTASIEADVAERSEPSSRAVPPSDTQSVTATVRPRNAVGVTRTGLHRLSGEPTLEWLRAQTVIGAAGCWLWTHGKSPDGYGRLSISGRDVQVHRVAYELSFGPIWCWLVTDHLCGVRSCINPAHLEVVTQVENIRRGAAPNAVASRTGVCARDHALEAVGGRMRCKVCQAERQREWYERRKEKLAAAYSAVLDRRSARVQP